MDHRIHQTSDEQSDALWNRVRAAFIAHQIRGIDHTSQMALDRIAAKCIGHDGLSFNASNCEVREEVLSLDQVGQLKRYHTRDRVDPRFETGSIVVLVYEGQRFVIDGNTRVNKWVNKRIDKPRNALIITPQK